MGTMDDLGNQTIEQLVQQAQDREMSRSRFIAVLAGLGASATAVATLTSVVDASASGTPEGGETAHRATEHYNKKLHHVHIERQAPPPSANSGATANPTLVGQAGGALDAQRLAKLQEILADYDDDAIVDDPLFDKSFVGKQAIMERKAAEMANLGGFTIEVVHRFAHRDQVVAEWIARGVIHGRFMGLTGNGRAVEMHGITVVTRKNGKIVRESLYYDLNALREQLA